MKQKILDHCQAAEALIEQVALLDAVVDAIVSRFKNGGRLYLCGNGGSAADAQHIAAEMVGRFKCDRRALPAVALTTDTSNLTAISNDLGADVIFARQVDALVTAADLLWVLSVSGTSPNILAAVEAAKAIGAFVIGFTGRRGIDAGPAGLGQHCDLCLAAAHEDSDRVQEVHQLAYHLVCERVEEAFASPGG